MSDRSENNDKWENLQQVCMTLKDDVGTVYNTLKEQGVLEEEDAQFVIMGELSALIDMLNMACVRRSVPHEEMIEKFDHIAKNYTLHFSKNIYINFKERQRILFEAAIPCWPDTEDAIRQHLQNIDTLIKKAFSNTPLLSFNAGLKIESAKLPQDQNGNPDWNSFADPKASDTYKQLFGTLSRKKRSNTQDNDPLP